MTIEDATRFALSVARTPDKDPTGSEAFANIVVVIRAAIETEIEARNK